MDVFGETNTREFEQTVSFVKKYWEEMGIPPQKMAQILERINDGVHLITETRELELLQEAGFNNVIRFYTGLWVGGWVAIKN